MVFVKVLIMLACAFWAFAVDMAHATPLKAEDFQMNIDDQRAAFKNYDHAFPYVGLIAACEEVPDEIENWYFDPFSLFMTAMYLLGSYLCLSFVWLNVAAQLDNIRGTGETLKTECVEEGRRFMDHLRPLFKGIEVEARSLEKTAEKIFDNVMRQNADNFQNMTNSSEQAEEGQLALFWIVQLLLGCIFWIEHWMAGPSGNKMGYPSCYFTFVSYSYCYKPFFPTMLACLTNVFTSFHLHNERSNAYKENLKEWEDEKGEKGPKPKETMFARPWLMISLNVVTVLLLCGWLLCAIPLVATFNLALVFFFLLVFGFVFSAYFVSRVFFTFRERDLKRKEDAAIAAAMVELKWGKLETDEEEQKKLATKQKQDVRELYARVAVVGIMFAMSCQNIGLLFFSETNEWGAIQLLTLEVLFKRAVNGFALPGISFPKLSLEIDLKFSIVALVLLLQKGSVAWMYWYSFPTRMKIKASELLVTHNLRPNADCMQNFLASVGVTREKMEEVEAYAAAAENEEEA